MIKRCVTVVACCVAALCMVGALCGCTSSETYAPESKSPTVQTPTIGQNGVLRVGVNTSNPPLAGQSTKIVGIDVDLAAAIADQMGLKLEIVDVGTNPAGALENGTVDIAMGVDASNSDAGMWKSDAYLPTAIALFAADASKSAPAAGSTPSIAAQVSSMSAWAVTNEFGAESLTSATDPKDAFAKLASGSVEYVAADAVIGTYAAYNTADDAVSIVALLQQPSGYCIGVLNTNSELKKAVGEAIDSLLSGGVVSVIETKWLGTTLDLSGLPVVMTAKATDEAEEAEDADKKAEDGEDAKASEGEAASTGTEPAA